MIEKIAGEDVTGYLSRVEFWSPEQREYDPGRRGLGDHPIVVPTVGAGAQIDLAKVPDRGRLRRLQPGDQIQMEGTHGESRWQAAGTLLSIECAYDQMGPEGTVSIRMRVIFPAAFEASGMGFEGTVNVSVAARRRRRRRQLTPARRKL